MLERDSDKLRLLSIAYVLLGGVSILGALGGLVSTAVLQSFFESIRNLSLSLSRKALGSETPWTLMAVGSGLMFLFGYAQIRVGLSISRRRARTFCLVVAAPTALVGPVGMAVAIFTFFVLTTPSVKAQFPGSEAAPFPARAPTS